MSLQSRLAALITAIGADIKALQIASSQSCRLYRTTAQPLTSGTWAAIAWDNAVYNTLGVGSWDGVTNNTRIVVPEDGLYRIKSRIRFAPHAAGSRDVQLRINGTSPSSGQVIDEDTLEDASTTAAEAAFMEVSAEVRLLVGDHIEVYCWQNSGGNLDLQSSADASTRGGRGAPHITVSKVGGPKGDKGDKGDQGIPGSPNGLPADEDGNVTDAERIGWRRLSDGALVAEIQGITTPGTNRRGHLKLTGLSDGANEKAQVDLEARGSNPDASALLFIQHQPYAATRKRHVSIQLTDDAGTSTVFKALLRSDGSSDFAPATSEGMNVLGVGPTAFAANWRRLTNDAAYDVSFYKAYGRVYLTGLAERINSNVVLPSTIFTLPDGYRPAKNQYLTVMANTGSILRFVVETTGLVYIDTVFMGSAPVVSNYLLMGSINSWRHA